MDPTARFFAKLKKLAVTLESDTARLQQSFENRNDDDDGGETNARGMRAYHELKCEVGELKGQIQEQFTQQTAQVNDVSSFLKACRVMEHRVSEDIKVLRGHWEKYGYQAPRTTQRPTKKTQDKGQEAGDDVEDEDEPQSVGEEEGSQEEAGEDGASSSPSAVPPPSTDALRTPQLSDFGLSEMQLKRAMAGAEWCSEVPPMPELSLPHPSLSTPAPPPMPVTPKCALRMDDDELQTPQMHDFGITEHTMCLNNDFTMDLLQKNIEKPQRTLLSKSMAPVDSLKASLQTKESLVSPEPPVFCTPGLKIKKAHGCCSPPAQENGDQGSPAHLGHLPTTPEVPAFKTPYVNRLLSTKKGLQSAQQQERIDMQAEDDGYTFKLATPTYNGANSSKHPWEYDVPEMSLMGTEDKKMPEMPNLESDLGNSLQRKITKIQKKVEAKEPIRNSLDSDGSTQEFTLGTPQVRKDYPEPSTPEMPDLSSVTQDICKLLSQAQAKRKTEVAVVQPNVRHEKKKSSVTLSLVSESEFQSLPGYLRQMTLCNLNQAVKGINKFTEQFPGEKTELQMEELRSITNAGTKTPIYALCLSELRRLEHVRGGRNTSVYRLSSRR